MPHVLYNHVTHSWDRPELDDDYRETSDASDEAPQFSPAARRVLERLALAAGAALTAFVLAGLVAGLLAEIP